MKHRLLTLALACLHLLSLLSTVALLASCTSGAHARRETITVFAAASLTDAFSAIAEAYEQEHAQARVTLNFAGSQRLAQQLAQGAPGDVFASASAEPMHTVQEAGRITAGSDRTFTTNTLVVITPPANEANIGQLSDLAKPGVRLILADTSVPVGHYAQAFLRQVSTAARFGDDYEKLVLENVVSYEQNVRAVLTKVALGEADAGIVYESDTAAASVRRIPIPDALNVVATYPIAAINDSSHPALAAAFIEFVLSPEGQTILVQHGFGTTAAAP